MSENKQTKPAEEKKDGALDGVANKSKAAEPKEEELVLSININQSIRVRKTRP